MKEKVEASQTLELLLDYVKIHDRGAVALGFAQLLGFRINKVRVTKYDDYIEIKPNGWLDKREWREINEILAKNGSEWKSCNIDSCWIKRLQQ